MTFVADPRTQTHPAPQPLLAGRRGLVMGVANDHSIAWGIARVLAAHGAELAFTYQTAAFGKRVEPLARQLGANLTLECDVGDEASASACFTRLEKTWGSLDFVIHAIAHSDKEELKGRYVDTTRSNFLRTMDVSCFSFTEVGRRAAALMSNGGSLVTLSYIGAEKVMPNYNVMGVAKVALEASVRYMANDLGPQGIRVNAISAGPMRTLAGSAIADARAVFRYSRDYSPLRRTPELDEIGGASLFLLSDLGAAVSGEVLHVDCGYHAIGMPHPSLMKADSGNGDG